MSDRFASLRAATCRVEGQWPLGTGLLIEERTVLTCRHVVEERKEVHVVFPWDAKGSTYSGRKVVETASVTLASNGTDLALLTLSAPAPAAEDRLDLPLGAPRFGKPFLAWGYRKVEGGRIEGGLPAYGELAFLSADRGDTRLLLKAECLAHGMSGAPVVQQAPWRVVGLATSKLNLEDSGLGGAALGLTNLGKCFPSLASLPYVEPEPEEAGQHDAPLRWLGKARLPSEVFVGREQELFSIDCHLAEAGRSVIGAAIEGLAGVGKTELALQYAYRYADPFRFPGGVLWLEAESDLSSQWLELALFFDLDPRGLTPDLVEREVLRRLAERRRLLVILDNAQRWDRLQGHLPYGADHAFLITTRERGFGGAQFRDRHLPLETLDQERARILVRILMGSRAEMNPNEVEAVVQACEGHPLALEVVAAYLGKYRHVAVDKFLHKFRGNEVKLPDGILYGKSFSRMMDEVILSLGSTAGAEDLLLLTGLYADAPASRSLIEETWKRLREEDDFDDAWSTLLDSHLVKEEQDGSWTVHRLIREEARQRGKYIYRKLLEAHSWSLKAFLASLDSYDSKNFVLILPHVEFIAEQAADREEGARVLATAQSFLWRLGRIHEAKTWAEQALASGLATLGADDPEVAVRRSNLGQILKVLGNLGGAYREMEEALRIGLTHLGENDRVIAVRRSILAQILWASGDLSGAAREAKEALRIYSTLDESDSRIAVLRLNIAAILLDREELAEARREIEEALRIEQARWGENHPKIAMFRSDLSTILRRADPEGARREAEEALRIDRAAFGEVHPNVAVRRSNLAVILQDLKDFSGAQREAEAALHIDREIFGEKHSRVAVRHSNLAFILRDLGDVGGAMSEAREAVRVSRLLPLGAPIRETILASWTDLVEKFYRQHSDGAKEEAQ